MQHHQAEGSRKFLCDTFTLMCWNTHKEMGRPVFEETFSELLKHHDAELVLLQEAVLDHHTPQSLDSYNYTAAVNIDLRHKQYGVLTASRAPILETLSIKTNRREMRVATRKSLLITTHPLQDGRELTAVNLHAINFVSAALFVEEIDRLIEVLLPRSGPMIVTGDFNTWSKKRLDYLERFAAAISLVPAHVENNHHIKRLFSKPLDHLYYRGLNLKKAEAIDTGRVSDHNPILATFSAQ